VPPPDARNGTTITTSPVEGTVATVIMDPDWQEHVFAAVDEYFLDDLGPRIRDLAKEKCPKRTGDLADSIERHLEGHDLIVSASGSDEREYALYVEKGHRIVAWGHQTGRVKGPEPFLVPALYEAAA
jgi:hypothetical protein